LLQGARSGEFFASAVEAVARDHQARWAASVARAIENGKIGQIQTIRTEIGCRRLTKFESRGRGY